VNLFAAHSRTSRSLPEHGECQEAASQDCPYSKGLRNGESRRDSLRVKSLTSRPQSRLTRRPSAIPSRFQASTFPSVCDERNCARPLAILNSIQFCIQHGLTASNGRLSARWVASYPLKPQDRRRGVYRRGQTNFERQLAAKRKS
jgi:hypothetical protein